MVARVHFLLLPNNAPSTSHLFTHQLMNISVVFIPLGCTQNGDCWLIPCFTFICLHYPTVIQTLKGVTFSSLSPIAPHKKGELDLLFE